MRTLYGTDSKHRLWTKTEYADGRIEIQMQKRFGDKPVKVTPSHKKGFVCFESGNSCYHRPIEYINWTTEKHTEPISTGYQRQPPRPPMSAPALEWLIREIETWREDSGSTE